MVTAGATESWHIGVLGGDGIGPEVTAEAVKVLRCVASLAGFELRMSQGLLGGCAIEAAGTPLPKETLALCQDVDALLVGAVGGPRWDSLPAEQNPGLGGLLRLRSELDLYANLRPGIPFLAQYSPLKSPDFDILLVREAVGGLYFSPQRGRTIEAGLDVAWDTMRYDASQIRRIAKVAFGLAERRRGKLTSVDKANVLEASKLWREIFIEEGENYPSVSLEHLYVDNCAMQLLIAPDRFDVLVTENLFGDILSDEIAGMIGSLGLLPSGSLRDDRFGLYEPVHGSAPDISGLGVANPAAAILSAALLLRHSLEKENEAQIVEAAVLYALRSGVRTPDLAGERPAVSTSGFGDAIVAEIQARFGQNPGGEG